MATKKKAEDNNSFKVVASTLTQETKALLNSYAEPEPETSYLETGNIGFDLALSNGLGMPLGASILLWAEPACGKTTLFGDVSKRLIASHKAKGETYKVLYIAVEGSRELLAKIGLKEYMDSRDFIYLERSFCWRNIEQLYDMVLNGEGAYKGVRLIVIDSINNVLSDQNIKNSIADGDFGTRSRERGNFYSKYLPLCKMAGINTFMIAQQRQNQDTMGMGAFAEKKKAAASDGDKHNADIVIKCKVNTMSKETVKLVEETAFGTDKSVEKYIMELDPFHKTSKNRYVRPHKCEVMIEKGVGVCNYYVVRKLLLFHGFIKKSGAYFSFDKRLCEAFGFPDKSMYKDPIDEIIQANIGQLVAFLKEAGCYTVVSPEKVTREEGALNDASDEDEDEVSNKNSENEEG